MTEEDKKETEETSVEIAKDETTVDSSAVNKKKKINRLLIEELNSKIEEIVKTNMTKSKYYKHLLQRKKELEN